MRNKYELVIKIDGEAKKKQPVTDPFEPKKTKQEKKLDNFVQGAKKAIVVNSSVAIVKGYTQTLGNSHLNDQINFTQSTLNSAISIGVMGSTFGPAGVGLGILMMLPSVIGQVISYNNGSTWDRISQNKGLRRAGPEFNRSRF